MAQKKRKRQVTFGLVLALLFTGLILIGANFLLQKQTNTRSKAASVGRIKLNPQNRKQLIDGNGQPFVIRSVQYMYIHDELPGSPGIMFSRGYYNHDKIAADLEKIASFGYNTIRLTYNNNAESSDANLSPGAFCQENRQYTITSCIGKDSMDNLADTLSLAQANNLRVILSMGGGLPDHYLSAPYSPYDNSTNGLFLREQAVRDYGRFLKDFFAYLQPSVNFDVLLGVEPFAEPSLGWVDTLNERGVRVTNGYPFLQLGKVLSNNADTPNIGVVNSENIAVVNSEKFYVPLGKPYGYFTVNNELLDKPNGLVSPKMAEILTFTFTNSFFYWSSHIKEVDPSLLIIYDQYPAKLVAHEVPAVRNVHYVNDLDLVNPFLSADIIGLQLYGNISGSPPLTLETELGFTPGLKEQLRNLQKPFIMIEFGINHNDTLSASDPGGSAVQWQVDSCRYGVSGWSYFAWPEFPRGEVNPLFTATDTNYQIARALSPNYRPDPCDTVSPLGLDGVRKADVSYIQGKLEAYKQTHGQYPATEWVTSTSGTNWIPGLSNLPQDPRNTCLATQRPREEGCYTYAYYSGGWCNLNGSGYILTTRLESDQSTADSQKPVGSCQWSEYPVNGLYTVTKTSRSGLF